MRNFRFVSQTFGMVIFLIESKLTPPNGSCAQDAAGTGVADQCTHLLVYFAMCPRLALTASFACFYNLIVLLYLFLQLLRHHGRTALFKSMAEQLWKAKFGTTPQKRPKSDLNLGVGSSYGTNKTPLPNPLFPYEFAPGCQWC